jgi:hypothetical protein
MGQARKHLSTGQPSSTDATAGYCDVHLILDGSLFTPLEPHRPLPERETSWLPTRAGACRDQNSDRPK